MSDFILAGGVLLLGIFIGWMSGVEGEQERAIEAEVGEHYLDNVGEKRFHYIKPCDHRK
jgi:hypothetical protein